jgi:xanthine/CO dehydrogenase XdhC/CoxF family maturation factor
MSDAVLKRYAEALSQGERAALVTVVGGPGLGNQLIVWSSGASFGDLGHPRLNQRVALFAEQLLERGSNPGPVRKRFPLAAGGMVEVEVTVGYCS